MNKHCFRVIFSNTLQRLVVTSELAKSAGKSTDASAFRCADLQISARIRPLVFSLFCALGFVAFSDTAFAELIIQADKSAQKNQQPIVLQTANGLPQVNIQTPNDKGLSHNTYSNPPHPLTLSTLRAELSPFEPGPTPDVTARLQT